MKKNQLILMSFLLFLLFSCFSGQTRSGRVLPVTQVKNIWEKASPESQGLDSRQLIRMMEQMQHDNINIDAVFIVRNGYLVFEAFNKPYRSEIPHRIHSCTKSVVSTLVGMAIEDGFIKNTEQFVIDLLPSRADQLKNTSADGLRLEHLLTMTSGYDSHDTYQENWRGLSEMWVSDDWLGFALTQKRKTAPGTVFEYSNQATYVLSEIISETTEMPTDEYARRELFDPIGISSGQWEHAPNGSVIGWGGLYFTAADLARFAWLVKNGGNWNGRQIVPDIWIREATSPKVTANTLQKDYGYQWWIAYDKTVMALGYSGQYAIIAPEINLVAVFLSALDLNQFHYPEQIYRTYIKNSISEVSLPENPDAVQKLKNLADTWERSLGSPRDWPEELIANSGRNYIMEENEWGISSIRFDLNDGNLIYNEVHPDFTIGFPVGNGSYECTEVQEHWFGFAAGSLGESEMEMHILELDQARWRKVKIIFEEEGIRITVSDSDRNYTTITGRME